MQCQHAQELFSDYVAGQTDRALSVTLDNHLAACDRCRDEVAGLRRTWDTLDRIPDVDLPAYFHENLMSRLDAERVQAEEAALRKRALWDWRLLFRPRPLAAAAAALVVLLASVEVVQTQRAELGPIGWVRSLIHPAPPILDLQTARTEWLPGASGGMLVVHLRPAAETSGRANLLSFRLTAAGHPEIMAQGNLTSDQETVLSMPLSETLNGPIALTLAVFPRNDEAHTKTTTLAVNLPSAAEQTAPAP